MKSSFLRYSLLAVLFGLLALSTVSSTKVMGVGFAPNPQSNISGPRPGCVPGDTGCTPPKPPQ